MRTRLIFVPVWLVAALASAPIAAAADPLVVSGRLTPMAENPSADPNGHGVAALTISADRTELTYRVTYADVGVPITAVYFCAGTIPRQEPIPIVCAFVIPKVPGGPSPITGTVPIVAIQAEGLASGFAVVQLDAAVGPQLAGYIEIGPPPPDTSTVGRAGRPSTAGVALPILAGLIAFVVALWRTPRRGGRPTVD